MSTIEFSLVEVSVLHGLKQGNEVLQEIHREMNIESVEKLMEETQEAREYQRVCHNPSFLCCAEVGVQEIGDLLANRLTNDEEDAVQDELQALQVEAVSTSYRTSFCDSHLLGSLEKQSLKCTLSCPLCLHRCHFFHPQKVSAVHACVVTILTSQQRFNTYLQQPTESGLLCLVDRVGFPFLSFIPSVCDLFRASIDPTTVGYQDNHMTAYNRIATVSFLPAVKVSKTYFPLLLGIIADIRYARCHLIQWSLDT